MKTLAVKIKEQRAGSLGTSSLFENEQGAIDLASIMVGIIVIGMIGGVIAATVFAVIPWAQDNAAKQQLDSVVAAESAYMGLSSTNPSSLPAGLAGNSYGSSADLKTAGLMNNGTKYCASITNTGAKGYEVFSSSSSGKIFTATDKNTKPVLFTGTLPTDCQFIVPVNGGATPPATYVDPTPKLTILTYRCDIATTGSIPLETNLTGTETWDDGVTNTYSGATASTPRQLIAGVEYTMTFDGTYSGMNASASTTNIDLSKCLRSVKHWGSGTGITNAYSAFSYASNLTDVPEHIPTTITNMAAMFNLAVNFNDPDISKWDVSNVTAMWYMFYQANTFNQNLDSWNVSNVTSMSSMFESASVFNQPLNSWDTSNVGNMSAMFFRTYAFNQPLDNWNTAKVGDMSHMFHTSVFNQPINSWNTVSVRSFDSMFEDASKFNQPLNSWNTGNVTTAISMFENAPLFNGNISSWNTVKITDTHRMFLYATSFNQPLGSWNVSNVTRSSTMFYGAGAFNQPLSSWNVIKVTDMSNMFNQATSFNDNLSGWNTVAVTSGANFAPNTFNSAYLPANTTKVP